MLYWVLVGLHIIVSFVLIAVVLLQTGKRADLAGAFGGGGSQAAFGPRGATNLLSRATTVCAIVFMVTSLGLAILSSRSHVGGGGSVLDEVPAAPAAPASPPAPAPNPEPSGK